MHVSVYVGGGTKEIDCCKNLSKKPVLDIDACNIVL